MKTLPTTVRHESSLMLLFALLIAWCTLIGLMFLTLVKTSMYLFVIDCRCHAIPKLPKPISQSGSAQVELDPRQDRVLRRIVRRVFARNLEDGRCRL